MAMNTWTSLGMPTNACVSSLPVVGKNVDGRLAIFLMGSDRALWHIWQVTLDGGWSTWTSLGVPVMGACDFLNPLVAMNRDGCLEAFVIYNNTLWHIWQKEPGGTWSEWASLGTPTSGIIELVDRVVGVNDDGRLEIFLVGSDNALWHIWQFTPGGAWSEWVSLDAPIKQDSPISGPTIGVNDDGRLEIFLVGSDNALWHIWQFTPGGAWSEWISLGAPVLDIPDDDNFIIATNSDGRLEAFVTYNEVLWHIWQLIPGGAWSEWTSLGSPPNMAGIIRGAIILNNNGCLEVFFPGHGILWHIWQLTPGGTWSEWTSLGAPPNLDDGIDRPAVTTTRDGCLELFLVGADRGIWLIIL